MLQQYEKIGPLHVTTEFGSWAVVVATVAEGKKGFLCLGWLESVSGLSVWAHRFDLREFVLTHVILAPGARGRGGPSSGPWRHLGGLGGIREIVPNRANYICFYIKSNSVTLRCNVFFTFHTPLM